MKKIPVFYHIPKNAGTYVNDWLLIGFRNYRTIKTDWLKRHTPDKESLRVIEATQNGIIVARILVGDPNYILDDLIASTKLNKRRLITELNEQAIKQIIDNCFLFAITIEAHGFKSRQQILNLFEGFTFHQFLILRDPFERTQSEFNYITSEESKHDYTHNAIHHRTLEDYILSNLLPDSWLIRHLLGLPDCKSLEEQNYKQTINLLDNEFCVYNINQTDKAISDVLKDCYNLNPEKFELQKWDLISKNKTVYKKVSFNSLSKEAQKTFIQRTYWDQMLYNYYFDKYD